MLKERGSHTISAMIRLAPGYAILMAIACDVALGQTTSAMPENLVIARHTFFDFGPPNDFYEIIQVDPNGNDLSVQRALLTPLGQACLQPPTVELSSGVLHETMAQLLASKNPCTIPEKELHRERKRCKSLVFSGVNVTMQVGYGGKDRQIRMDILDRDLFDPAAGTPKNTSWSMTVLKQLDSALGPGVMEKPTFSLGTSGPAAPPATPLVQGIEAGDFDSLFGEQTKVSEIAQAAANGPPPPPTVAIESISPVAPIATELPKYPPIARLAHVEGLVEATFDVGGDGLAKNIEFVSEPRGRMLQLAVSDALSKWEFPESAWGKRGKVSIRFKLNCKTNPA
jgi:hypothetical protein